MSSKKLFLGSATALLLFANEMSGIGILVNQVGETPADVAAGGIFNTGTLQGDLRGALNYINSQPTGTWDITFSLGTATIPLGGHPSDFEFKWIQYNYD